MFAGAWGHGAIVRLGEQRTQKLIESGSAEVRDPTGHRPKREYVFLDRKRVQIDAELIEWFTEAAEFVGALPPAARKSRKKTVQNSGDN